VDRGCDVHVRGWCGASALHPAARYGHASLVEWLVARGAAVDLQDEFHHTPLRHAVEADSVNVARALVALGANVIASDDCGYRPVHLTTSREMLELLLNAGADVNDSGGWSWPLAHACGVADASLVQFLLERGAQPDLTSSGETALFSAVSSDSLECVRLLLDAGADVNAQDVDGWTCLWHVRSVPMARMLLERGADPSIFDQCGGFPEDWSLPLEVSALYMKARLGLH
jgi:ankyrin repeat protein